MGKICRFGILGFFDFAFFDFDEFDFDDFDFDFENLFLRILILSLSTVPGHGARAHAQAQLPAVRSGSTIFLPVIHVCSPVWF